MGPDEAVFEFARIRFLIGSVVVAALVGCTGFHGAQSTASCMLSEPSLLGYIDGRDLARQLAEDLCPKGQSRELSSPQSNLEHDLLVVADPVDIQTYVPSHLGRAFGDIFRAEILQKCGTPIRQVELSRDFNLMQQGLTALTRNLRDVRGSQFQAREAVITTYSLAKNRVVFVARRINLEPGAIVAMSTREASWTCDPNLMGVTSVRATFK